MVKGVDNAPSVLQAAMRRDEWYVISTVKGYEATKITQMKVILASDIDTAN